MAKRVSEKDQPNIVWHAPETIASTLPDVAKRFDEQMKGKSPSEVLAAAAQLSGEYRALEGEEFDPELRGTKPVWSDERYVWVATAAGKDPAGHFEVYDGPDEEYQPVIQYVEES